jgi:hypothetical protein
MEPAGGDGVKRAVVTVALALVGITLGGCDLMLDQGSPESPPTSGATYEGQYEDQLRQQGQELTEEWQRQQCQEAQKDGLLPPDFDC